MYDVAIIGLGAAGYTSAIYTARYKLSTLVVGEDEGGMGVTAAEVGNWPGAIEIKGHDLMDSFKKHAESFENVMHKQARVEKVGPFDCVQGKQGCFQITYQNGETDEAKTIIFATGSDKRHLGVPGEDELSGKGVTYCATCDAFFYKGKDVAVLGGGDSAVEGAAIAAQVANKVYLIHRRKEFRAEPFWVDEIKKRDNVEYVLGYNVKEILGDEKVTGIKLDKEFNGSDTINVDGVFIEIGSIPSTSLAEMLGCEIDDRKHLKVGEDMQTSVKGIFAAGDVSSGSNYFAQFATAAGEGSIAGNSVFNYLQGNGRCEGYLSEG